MTSKLKSLAQCFEYDDDISVGDSDVEFSAVHSVDYLEEGGDDAEYDNFLAIWGESTSDDVGEITTLASEGLNIVSSSSESNDFDKDDNLSESDDSFEKNGGYSSDEMLSEDSETGSHHSLHEFGTLSSNAINSTTNSSIIGENLSRNHLGSESLSNLNYSFHKLGLESKGTKVRCAAYDYYENDESKYLMGDIDSGSEMNKTDEIYIGARKKIQRRKPRNINIEENSDIIRFPKSFGKEFGHVNKKEMEYFVGSNINVSLTPVHPSKTSSRDEGENKYYNKKEHNKSQRIGSKPTQISQVLLMMDIKEDERSTVSDKTQKVRNTCTLKESSHSTLDCIASTEEQWNEGGTVSNLSDKIPTAKLDSKASGKEQWHDEIITSIPLEASCDEHSLSRGSEFGLLSSCDSNLSQSYRCRSKSNKKKRILPVYIAIGIVALVIVIVVVIFIGLRRKIEDNEHFVKESNKQETVPLSPSLSPSLSPTISYFHPGSVRRGK